jgi:hypothetical protein
VPALMDFEEFTKDKLWLILVETVHANVMYPTHKSYTRDVLLPAKPDISAEEISSKLNLPMGEAIVILYELADVSKNPQ